VALPRILVLVLAGGAGGRLGLLTDERAKPAVPYGGEHRLIDFSLSNAAHALVQDVWVVQQFNPATLIDHLSNGRPWDLDRTAGGLRILHPHRGTDREGWHQGTADALWRQAPLVRELAPDALVVVSADAVYRMDYREIADGHLASDAAATIVTTEVEAEDASRYGVVVTGGEQVRDYAYKPEDPRSRTVTTEVFVFTPEVVLDELERMDAELGEKGMGDLGDHLLPRLVDAGAARATRFPDYWRDVGTVEAYWESHQDLVADDPPFRLDDPAWPIRTTGGRYGPARLRRGARVERSLLSSGAIVAGRVRGSVLSPGVVVEDGATVVDSVLLPGVVLRSGARVERAVLDDRVEVRPEAVVGGRKDVTLVGRGTQVRKGRRIAPGRRVPEPE